MRPPICEVCDVDAREQPGAGTDGFVLVTCAATPESRAWRERAKRDHMVGHPPDVGWFCARHADAARGLAAELSLAEVIAGVRAADVPGGFAGVAALHSRLVALLPRLAEHAGVDPAAIERRTERRWNPMDGAVPTDCPFVDSTTHSSPGRPSVSLRLDEAWWNEAEPANAFVLCLVHGTQGRDLAVSASADVAAGRPDSAAPSGPPDSAAPPTVTIEGDAPAWLREALGPSASA